MNASSDQPLDLPRQTLDAINKARGAVRRTRQTVEVAFAPLIAGGALAAVGQGSFVLFIHAPVSDWVRWPLDGLAMASQWAGVILMWWFVWTWYRWGRRGGRQSPLADAFTTLGVRRRFGMLAFCLLSMAVGGLALQALRPYISNAVYVGTTIWGARLAVLAAIAFFVYRFVRSGFWEYLVFAAGIAGTLGLFFVGLGEAVTIMPAIPRAIELSEFADPAADGAAVAEQPELITEEHFAPTCIAALSLLSTLVATASLVGRWRRWTRANQAAQAAAIDDPTSQEVA